METVTVSIANKTTETDVLTQAEEDAILAQEVSQADADLAACVAKLTASDQHMARITEDLINILVANNTIQLTDFTVQVQDILADRTACRAAIQGA